MKIIVGLTIKAKKENIPYLIDELNKHGLELQKIVRADSGGNYEIFNLEINYSSKQGYDNFIEKIVNSKNFNVVETRNLLEEGIIGGLLNVSGKIPLESISDYELRIQGSAILMLDKIARGNGYEYSGISNSVGNISAVKMRPDMPPESFFRRHVQLERDSLITNRFTRFNAYPIIIKYNQIEDLIKTIQGIESTFSIIRIVDLEEIDDISQYEQIYSEISIPVVSALCDELPLYLLSEILYLLEQNHTDIQDAHVGIIGLNVGAMRLTKLLIAAGCGRILGCDNNEKLMMIFEKCGGLATTPENIFNNSDLVILMKNHFTVDEFNKIRTSQIIISLIDEDPVEKNIISDRRIKNYISHDSIDTTLIFPGLLKGIYKTKNNSLSDYQLIEMSQKIHQLRKDDPRIFSLFGDIHEKIASFFP